MILVEITSSLMSGVEMGLAEATASGDPPLREAFRGEGTGSHPFPDVVALCGAVVGGVGLAFFQARWSPPSARVIGQVER